MNKADLLKQIAEAGYNIGYGAKKHFATYDIVEKIPNFINFLLLSIGILSLFINTLSTKLISAVMIILGIVGLYIGFYGDKHEEYNKTGKYLTSLYDELKTLYYKIKSEDYIMQIEDEKKLKNILDKYHKRAISKQILFSDWYAHYKFFWQHQIEWIEEQKNFSFLRDRIPLTFTATFLLSITLIVGYIYGDNILQAVENSFHKG
jgi:hypothetical protein